jgi:hypothetical protein
MCASVRLNIAREIIQNRAGEVSVCVRVSGSYLSARVQKKIQPFEIEIFCNDMIKTA